MAGGFCIGGIDTYAERVCRRRRDRVRFGRRTEQVLLADFWYFSSLKSTIKEKSLQST